MPADHVSRSPNDTYYIDTDTVLRCHTSAHQAATLRQGQSAFLITGAGTQGIRPARAMHAIVPGLVYSLPALERKCSGCRLEAAAECRS